MILLRLLNRLYAFVGGYFWLPCPVCHKEFGGHEASFGTPLIVQQEDGQHAYGVCSRKCSLRAEQMNDQNGYQYPRRML